MGFLRTVSVYSIGSIVSAGIPMLLLPLITHYLSPEDYGILRLFSAYVVILVPILGLVSQGIASVEYFKSGKEEFASLFTTMLRIPVTGLLVFTGLALVLGKDVSSLLHIDADWVIVIPFLAFFTILTDTCLTMMIMQKKPVPFVLFTIGRTLIEMSLTVFLIVWIGMKWEGRVLGWLIAIGLFAILALIYFKRNGWLSGRYSSRWLKKSISFGTPLIPHSIGKFVVNQSDLLFITALISTEATGLYGVGYQFGFLLAVLSSALLNYIGPYINERLADITEDKKIEIVRISYMYMGILIIAAGFICVISEPVFIHLLDSRYLEGEQYVFWIALSYLFWGGYMVFARYLFFFEHTRILAMLAIFNITLNLALNYLLIPLYGTIGAAYATVISFFSVFLGVMISAHKVYPMPWFYWLKK